MESSEYIVYNHSDELTDSERELIAAANEALPHSYAPYSTFHVACAIRLDNGEVVTGVNQENASSPAGLCAEQVALYRKGIAFPDARVLAMAVVAQSEKHPNDPPAISPCGICRQVMLEFVHRQEHSYPVIMQAGNNSWIKVLKMESLLPFGFTANSL